jgi:hypothetical protein
MGADQQPVDIAPIQQRGYAYEPSTDPECNEDRQKWWVKLYEDAENLPWVWRCVV